MLSPATAGWDSVSTLVSLSPIQSRLFGQSVERPGRRDETRSFRPLFLLDEIVGASLRERPFFRLMRRAHGATLLQNQETSVGLLCSLSIVSFLYD